MLRIHWIVSLSRAVGGHGAVIADPMKILVDVEERRSAVPECLRSLGTDVEFVRLAVADYALAPSVAVERKTVSDLHRALVTGRLWSQIAALRHDLDVAYLIVEGADLDAGRGVTPSGVRGALLSVLDGGIRLVRTDGPQDSARWLRLMAARWSAAADGRSVRLRGRRRAVVSPAGLLATVPGISPGTARRLVERFGSVSGVASATEAELRDVPRIGPARAAALRRILAGPSSQLGAFSEAESARLRAPSSRSASPEVPASPARIGRDRGT